LLSQDLHQTVPDIMSGESKWEALGSGMVSPYHCCCVPQRSGQVSRVKGHNLAYNELEIKQALLQWTIS
jgi:hypothetical protein